MWTSFWSRKMNESIIVFYLYRKAESTYYAFTETFFIAKYKVGDIWFIMIKTVVFIFIDYKRNISKTNSLIMIWEIKKIRLLTIIWTPFMISRGKIYIKIFFNEILPSSLKLVLQSCIVTLSLLYICIIALCLEMVSTLMC